MIDPEGTCASPEQTAAVWREFRGRLQRFVARRVPQEADAEDIVQKVFLRVHRGLPRLRHQERLGAWLYRAARNAIADHYRAPSRRREVSSGDAVDIEALERSAAREDEPEGAGPLGCLRPLIDALPADYRRAIVRVELEGLTQARAAELEGLSLSGMKTRVQRGRRRLREMLLDCCRQRLDGRAGLPDCEPGGGASCVVPSNVPRSGPR